MFWTDQIVDFASEVMTEKDCEILSLLDPARRAEGMNRKDPLVPPSWTVLVSTWAQRGSWCPSDPLV